MNKEYNEITKKLRSEPATLILGKKGLTEEFIGEVKRQLKRRKVIKIKTLKSVLAEKSMNEIASEIAMKANSRILETRGHTMLLARKKF
ncbi:MAG: YhbY family RNA-binding protein [Candidatus Jordarchaeaceae archaeon]